MDICQGAATGALLLNAGSAGRLAQHSALGDKYDVTVGEFLFEFPCKPASS